MPKVATERTQAELLLVRAANGLNRIQHLLDEDLRLRVAAIEGKLRQAAARKARHS